MDTRAGIPQFTLRNSQGNAVDFDLQEWGAAENYDFLKAHRHHFHEILVFIKGGARHDIDFTTHVAKTGSIHFVASDNVHLLVRDERSKGFSLLFSPDYIAEEVLSQLPFFTAQPVVVPDKKTFRLITGLARLIHAEHTSPQVLSPRIVRSLTEALLLHLIRANTAGVPSTATATTSVYIQRFKQLIKEQYMQHLSVEAYAGLLAISVKHLIAICKEQTGKTPLKHIQEYTLSQAKRLLFHTALPVKEIAYRLNFDDPTQFSKYFKLHTGYSPAAYRKGRR